MQVAYGASPAPQVGGQNSRVTFRQREHWEILSILEPWDTGHESGQGQGSIGGLGESWGIQKKPHHRPLSLAFLEISVASPAFPNRW